MLHRDIVTSFGTDKAQYILGEESTDYSVQGGTPWEDVMVVIVQILPERCTSPSSPLQNRSQLIVGPDALMIARPADGTDVILFSATVEDDWLFSCDEVNDGCIQLRHMVELITGAPRRSAY